MGISEGEAAEDFWVVVDEVLCEATACEATVCDVAVCEVAVFAPGKGIIEVTRFRVVVSPGSLNGAVCEGSVDKTVGGVSKLPHASVNNTVKYPASALSAPSPCASKQDVQAGSPTLSPLQRQPSSWQVLMAFAATAQSLSHAFPVVAV